MAVAGDEHADPELGINRRPARLAVERPQVLADADEINEALDRAQQMIGQGMALKAELVEQRRLLKSARPSSE